MSEPAATLGRRVRRLAAGLAWLVACAAPAHAKESDVIYPRNAAPAAVPAAGPASGVNSTLLLLGAVAAAAGGFYFWRQRRAAGPGGAAPRKLAIAESRALGNRQYLVVADYEGRKFLLGVCPGRIDMLTRLDDGTDEGA